MNRALLTLFLLTAPTCAAFAAGESYTRQLSATNAGMCDDGKLIEETFEGGNIHGFSSSVFVACLQTPNTATWVFTAAETCEGDTVCQKKPVNEPPKFFGTKDWYERKRIIFNLSKYAKGTRCRIVAMKIAQSFDDLKMPLGDASVWVCDRFDTHQSNSKPFILKTVGPSAPTPDYNLDQKVTAVALGRENYTLDWVSEVIDIDTQPIAPKSSRVQPPPTIEPPNTHTSEKEDLDHDWQVLVASGERLVASGALKFSISGWNNSLDITLRDLSAAEASAIVQNGCDHPTDLRRSWNLRVYLVDGTLAGQCRFITHVEGIMAQGADSLEKTLQEKPWRQGLLRAMGVNTSNGPAPPLSRAETWCKEMLGGHQLCTSDKAQKYSCSTDAIKHDLDECDARLRQEWIARGARQ
jgi:hypothetical protein